MTNTHRTRIPLSLILTALVSLALHAAPSRLHAAERHTWASPIGGSLSSAANWGGIGPQGGPDVAYDFSRVNLATNPTSLTLDGDQTVGALIFGDKGNKSSWIFEPGTAGTLTLAVTTGVPTIHVENQSTTLRAPLSCKTVFQKTGAGTLILDAKGLADGIYPVLAGTLQLTGGPEKVGFNISKDAMAVLAYSPINGYGQPTTIHGGGADDPTGLQLSGDVTLTCAGPGGAPGLILADAPTTVRAQGGAPKIQGFDTHYDAVLVSAAASGSVLDAGLTVETGSYGFAVNAERGANTATGDLSIRGPIVGTGKAVVRGEIIATGLHKFGPGSVCLNAACTFAAGVSVADGALILANAGGETLPANSTVVLGSNAKSGQLILNGVKQTFAALYASGTGTDNAVLGGSATVSELTIVNGSGTPTALAACLGGGGANQNNLALVKNGTGSLLMAGVSSYTGPTTVSQGLLYILKDAALGATDVTVVDGAAVGGKGKIGGTLTVGSKAGAHFLHDGTVPGVLHVTGNVTFKGAKNEVIIWGTNMQGPLTILTCDGTITGEGSIIMPGTTPPLKAQVFPGKPTALKLMYESALSGGAPVDSQVKIAPLPSPPATPPVAATVASAAGSTLGAAASDVPAKTMETDGFAFDALIATALKTAHRAGATAKTLAILGPGLPIKDVDDSAMKAWKRIPVPSALSGAGVTPDVLLSALPAFLAKNKPEVVVLVGGASKPRKPAPDERHDWCDVLNLCARFGAVPITAVPPPVGAQDEQRTDLVEGARLAFSPTIDLTNGALFAKHVVLLYGLVETHVLGRAAPPAQAAKKRPDAKEE